MNFEQITLPLSFKPLPWARPGGKSIRYDTQLNDKNAFGILAVKHLNTKYTERNWDVLAGPNFPAGTPVNVAILFSFKDERKSTRGVPYPLPDVDNLCKFVLDALQTGYLEGLIWADDKQVIHINGTKKFAEKNEIYINITKG